VVTRSLLAVPVAAAIACTLFPAGSLTRRECDYRARQGIQHPEVRPHVDVSPIKETCSEARTAMRWSELPCAAEAAKQQPAKKLMVPKEKKQ
jgi:hypothetical protein